MSERATQLARELLAELDCESRAHTAYLCCVCRDRVAGVNWMRESQTSCCFYFCQTHWDELVVPKGIHWYNGIPVFRVIGMRGALPMATR